MQSGNAFPDETPRSPRARGVSHKEEAEERRDDLFVVEGAAERAREHVVIRAFEALKTD